MQKSVTLLPTKSTRQKEREGEMGKRASIGLHASVLSIGRQYITLLRALVLQYTAPQ